MILEYFSSDSWRIARKLVIMFVWLRYSFSAESTVVTVLAAALQNPRKEFIPQK